MSNLVTVTHSGLTSSTQEPECGLLNSFGLTSSTQEADRKENEKDGNEGEEREAK